MKGNLTTKNITYYLSGGGDDIYRVLAPLENVVKGKVAYMVIATEVFSNNLLENILSHKNEFIDYLEKHNSESVEYITKENIEEIINCDTLIISGGNTKYLIKTLAQNNFYDVVQKSKLKIIAGISAGAIALARVGVGESESGLVEHHGFGLVDIDVVPHSDEERRKKYPQYVQIAEYEWVRVRNGKIDHDIL